MSDLDRIRLAARMAGHGFHPDHVVKLCRHYLDVDLLPGSHPLSTDEVARLEAELDQVVVRYEKSLGFRVAALGEEPT